MSVPLMNPRAQMEPLMDTIRQRILEIVDSGRYVLGKHVKAFEREAAQFLGVQHAVGVANGTDALIIAMRALGIQPGDEVICPAYTFYATAEAIAAIGATPVFADVDKATYTLDPESVRALITGRTKALMPVHLFGQAADMHALRDLADEHGLVVIEDAAQAFGARYDGKRVGSLGDAATFSFYPTKNLGGMGDGGLLVTDRADVAEAARKLRFHGSTDKVTFDQIGYNSRLDELQAGVLRLLLPQLDEWNGNRAQIARWYAEAGLGDVVGLPHVAGDRDHIYHLFVADTDHRSELIAGCREQGIGAAVYYGKPMHLQPVFASFGHVPGDLPVTETMGERGVALPMFPTMTRAQVDEVVAAVRAAVPTPVVG